MKTALKVVAALLGIPLALLLAWLAINLVDEPLTAQAKAILTAPLDPYPAGDNIYVGMMGFDAPTGQLMIRTGQMRIEAYNLALDRLLASPSAAAAFAQAQSRSARLAFQGSLMAGAKPASVPTLSLWEFVKTHRARLASVLGRNQELYRRYLTLHGLTGYFETEKPSALAPLAVIPPGVHSLFLAQVANRIQIGSAVEQSAALVDLARDVRMWQTVLDGTGGMLSKMLAAGALHDDFLLTGDMVTDPQCDQAFLRDVGHSLLTPFPARDWAIGGAYDHEMRLFVSFLRGFKRGPPRQDGSDLDPARWPALLADRLALQLFKYDATVNLEAERTGRLRALADGDPATFSRRQQAFADWERRRLSGFLYNPFGRILLRLGTLNGDFPQQVYDVAALQRLVYLAYLVRHRQIARENVAVFMRDHPPWSTQPLDAKPLSWDPATGWLKLSPAGHEPPFERFGLKLFRQPDNPAGSRPGRAQLCVGTGASPAI
jgi:hypothetical protein